MKKTNLETLKANLAFMKKHLTHPEEFPGLIEETAAVVEQFKADRTQTEAPEKKRIQALKRALEKLTDADRKLLACDVSEPGSFLNVLPGELGNEYDFAPLMLEQCAAALDEIKYSEEHPEEEFLILLRQAYRQFTRKPATYNHTGLFVKFCQAAYEEAGIIAEAETIRDKVRKFVFVYTNTADQTRSLCEQGIIGLGIKYHPKSPKTVKKTRGKN